MKTTLMPMDMAKIAFLGLGAMGSPIAGHLAKAGHELTVYNRTRAKAETWVNEHGGTIAPSAVAAVDGAEAVFASVGTDRDLENVTMRHDGCFNGMKKGALFVDHSSVSAGLARQLATEGRDRGLLVVDAPVTGAEIGARGGTLNIMCGGSDKAVAAAIPFMQVYSSRIVHVGGPGAGQLTKMVNQIALAGTLQAVAEALRFAQREMLDTAKVFEAVSGGAASSWMLSNRWASMSEDRFDFGLKVDLLRKDLGLAMEEARGNGASIPIAALIDQFYADVQAMGAGRDDMSALVKRLPK
jgi:3-hydroxyisobutyrate dehydrogenase